MTQDPTEGAGGSSSPQEPETSDASRLENKIWYLRNNRLFAQTSDDAVTGSAGIFTVKPFPAKSQVFDQGDTDRTIFLLKRGKIRIARLTSDGKEVTIAVLGAGDIFGEETLFDQRPRTTIATCIDDCLLCIAKADDLMGLLRDDPTLSLNVAKVLNERLDDALETIEDLAYARVADRLMNLFTRLAEEHGKPTPEGTLIDVRLTHADIASLVGSTRETVSLELSSLVNAGRLALHGRSFVLPR